MHPPSLQETTIDRSMYRPVIGPCAFEWRPIIFPYFLWRWGEPHRSSHNQTLRDAFELWWTWSHLTMALTAGTSTIQQQTSPHPALADNGLHYSLLLRGWHNRYNNSQHEPIDQEQMSTHKQLRVQLWPVDLLHFSNMKCKPETTHSL